MNRRDKRDFVIKRYNEGATWDKITDEAKVSPKTIKKIVSEYEESQAFELFDKGVSPIIVKIELGIPPESAEKYFIAYNKIKNLIDLSIIFFNLGTHLSDFIEFYNSARGYGITPFNMFASLKLAMDTESLNQANISTRNELQATLNSLGQEKVNLDETRRQITILTNILENDRIEIKLLNSVIAEIKNSKEYGIFEQTIRNSVNSLSYHRLFLIESTIIAIMKLIQKDPVAVSLLQFPFPEKVDMTAHTAFHQLMLNNLVQKVQELMPEVLDEMSKFTATQALPYLQNLESSKLFHEKFPGRPSDGTITVIGVEYLKDSQSRERPEIMKDVAALDNVEFKSQVEKITSAVSKSIAACVGSD